MNKLRALFIFELRRFLAGRLALLAFLFLLSAELLMEWTYGIAMEGEGLPGQGAHLLTVTVWPYALLALSSIEMSFQPQGSFFPVLFAMSVKRVYITGVRFCILSLFLLCSVTSILFISWLFALHMTESVPGLLVWLYSGVTLFMSLMPCLSIGALAGAFFSKQTLSCVMCITLYMLMDLLKNRLYLDAFFFSSFFDKPFAIISDAAMGLPSFPLPYSFYVLLFFWIALPLLLAAVVLHKKEIV